MSANLKRFKEKRKQWIHCFSGDDRHSIINQISNLVWNAAVFKVINEARRIATDNGQKQAEMNGMLHRFIDRCFFDSQLLSVRRICDPGPVVGTEGVFSLVSLMDDMKRHIALMTRENFFIDEELEYSIEKIHQKEMDYFRENTKNGTGALWIPKEVDIYNVEIRHKEIDRLSGVSEDARNPEDTVSLEILAVLIKKVKTATENIKLRVDQTIAHAASPDSRQYKKSDEISLTLNCLWESHHIICQVANFIDMYLLSRASHSFLPTPQYNHLEFIDKSFIETGHLEVMSNVWHEFHRETDGWGAWGLSDLILEIQNTGEANKLL